MKSMYFLISPNCNLKCKYCFQLDNAPEAVGSKSYHAQPRVVANREVIDQLAQFCIDNEVSQVQIFGGEPLFYREAFEYTVNTLCDKVPGIGIGVITNGTLITEAIMNLFETRPVSILLSLDGGRDRHNEMRGGFDRIEKWLDRLAAQGAVSVAMQAGVVGGLYENIKYIWNRGLKRVFVNVIESHGWYGVDDVKTFEHEYERALEGMIRGEGTLSCAVQMFDSLKRPDHPQGCGITREGLACDWHGLLYPCHRAMELGTALASGSIFDGVDVQRMDSARALIHQASFRSASAAAYPLVTYCPVATYQKHKTFSGAWSVDFCEMINAKAKLVSKYFFELRDILEPRPTEHRAVSTRESRSGIGQAA